jgi:hypothetical protein
LFRIFRIALGFSRATFQLTNHNFNQKMPLMNSSEYLFVPVGGLFHQRPRRGARRGSAAPFHYHPKKWPAGTVCSRFAAEIPSTVTDRSLFGVAQSLSGVEESLPHTETSWGGTETPFDGAETSRLHTRKVSRGAEEPFCGAETSSYDTEESFYRTEKSFYRTKESIFGAGETGQHAGKPFFDNGFCKKRTKTSLNQLGAVKAAHN